MELQFHRLQFVSFQSYEYASLIPDSPIEIEEGDLLEIMSGQQILFSGRVCSVWESELAMQVVHAVATSTSSSTGDPHLARVGRATRELKRSFDDLTDWERDQVLENLKKGG